MPEGRRRLIQALGGMFGRKADKLKLVPAVVGAYFNGQKTLRVAGRDDFIWARIRGGTSEVVQVFNDTVQAHWDLPILVYRDPNYPDIWKVYGRDISRYEDWGGINYLPPHANQHAFGGGRTGGDVVWIFKRQFMPLLPHPNATATMSIFVEPDFYYWEGGYVWFGGTGTADLSGSKPTGGSNARYVSVYIDGDSGNLLTIAGEEFDAIWTPDTPADLIPVPTPDQGVPIAAVLLMTGTSTIGWGEIFDIRNIVGPLDLNSLVTYTRAGDAIPLATITGGYWRVPDDAYATGSLSIMINGVWQRPVTDFREQFSISGTFIIGDEGISTGSFVSAIWGAPT